MFSIIGSAFKKIQNFVADNEFENKPINDNDRLTVMSEGAEEEGFTQVVPTTDESESEDEGETDDESVVMSNVQRPTEDDSGNSSGDSSNMFDNMMRNRLEPSPQHHGSLGMNFSESDHPAAKYLHAVPGHAVGNDKMHYSMGDSWTAGLKIFKDVKGLYQVVTVVPDQQDNRIIDKVLIDREQLRRFCKDSGYDMDTSNFDFNALNDCRVDLVGVYGSKLGVVDFLSNIRNSESLTTKLRESMKGDDQTVSKLSAGLYLWINGTVECQKPVGVQLPAGLSEESMKQCKKGVVFLWTGPYDIFESGTKSSIITTLIRYLMDLSSNHISVVMTEDESSDFDKCNKGEFQKKMSVMEGSTVQKTTQKDNFEVSEGGDGLQIDVADFADPSLKLSFSRGNRQISVVAMKKKSDNALKRSKKTKWFYGDDMAATLLNFFKSNHFRYDSSEMSLETVHQFLAGAFPADCDISKFVSATTAELQSLKEARSADLRKLDEHFKSELRKRIEATTRDFELVMQLHNDGKLDWASVEFESLADHRDHVAALRRRCTCGHCNEVLDEPKMLGCCGATFCHKCVCQMKTLGCSEAKMFFGCPVCTALFDPISMSVCDDVTALQRIQEYHGENRKFEEQCSKESARFKNAINKYQKLKEVKKQSSSEYYVRMRWEAFNELLPSKFASEKRFRHAVLRYNASKKRTRSLKEQVRRFILEKYTCKSNSLQQRVINTVTGFFIPTKTTPTTSSTLPTQKNWDDAFERARQKVCLDSDEIEKLKQKCVNDLQREIRKLVRSKLLFESRRLDIESCYSDRIARLKKSRRQGLIVRFSVLCDDPNAPEAWLKSVQYKSSRKRHIRRNKRSNYGPSAIILSYEANVKCKFIGFKLFKFFPKKNLSTKIFNDNVNTARNLEGKFLEVKKWNVPTTGV